METKKKIDDFERQKVKKDQFIRVEGQPLSYKDDEDKSGLKRIRYGVQELVAKFSQGLAGGQEEVRPKKINKLVKKLQNL